MKYQRQRIQDKKRSALFAVCVASLLVTLSACGSMSKDKTSANKSLNITLNGEQCVPPVNTEASGSASITVNVQSGEISGHIDVSGMQASKAHIHLGASGQNGKVAVNLEQSGPNRYMVPDFTTLEKADLQILINGGMYFQVHSKDHPKGELRGQIRL